VRKKLDERERRRGDAQQINAEVKEKVEEIYNQLDRMREAVSSEKGANVAFDSLSRKLRRLSTTSLKN
jgi:F0F1-type ATP synthase membrane subunit b/b'